MPRGTFHTSVGTGATEGRLLHLAVPGGIEDSLEEIAFTSDGSRARVVGPKHEGRLELGQTT